MISSKLDIEKQKCASEYNKKCRLIVLFVKQKAPGCQYLNDITMLLREADELVPFMLIDRSKKNMWEHRLKIVERNEDYFKNYDASKHWKPDHNYKVLKGIEDFVRANLEKMNQKEKDQIWNIINEMLELIIKYMELLGEIKA